MGLWNYIFGGSNQYVQRTFDNFKEVQRTNEIIFGIKPDYSNDLDVKEDYINQLSSKTLAQMTPEEKNIYLTALKNKWNSPEVIKSNNDFHQKALDTADASRKSGIIGAVMVGDINEKSDVNGAVIEKSKDGSYTVKFINDKTGSTDGSYNINRDKKEVKILKDDSNPKTDTGIDIVIDAINSEQSNTETANETPEPTISDASNAKIDSSVFENAQKAVTKKINSITNNNPYHEKIDYSKKVSLNVAPINKEVNISSTLDKESWESRLGYILGNDTSKLLYSLFASTRGIVFPYTPSIKMEHAVSYEQTDIIHSNLSVQHYKNTPPPSINVTADFTADNQKNALYMYGAMCFLRAMTKCEFGLKTIKNGKEGVPPPILYLNGWGNMINNIPVVITNFSIDLPKDKHYVYLKDETYGIDVWLPTQMSFSIQLKIQFNLDKYKHQFDLNEYKNGILTSNTQTKNNVSIINTLDTEKNGENIVLYDSSKQRTFNGSGWTW